MATDAELQAIADGGTPNVKVETPAGGQVETKVQTPAPVSFKDEDLVELTVNGEKVVKPYREVKDGWQRQEDYTRKSQDVANRLKEVKELYDGLTAKQKELVTKEEAIDAVLGRTPRGGAKEVPADDEVVPYGTIKQTVAELLKAAREEDSRNLSAQFTQQNEARTFERWEEKVVDTVEKLTQAHPILAKLPNLVGSLKRMAKDDNPQSESEMLAAIVKAGKRVAKDIDDDYSERRKQDDIKRKNLREHGPEPGGGQTSFKAPEKSYVKGRKIDWDGLEKDVIAQLESMDE
jgi:hypothetical protein